MAFNLKTTFAGLELSASGASHSYVIEQRTDCANDVYTELTSGTLADGESFVITQDGRFRIAFDDCTEDSCKYVAVSYLSFLTNLVADIKDLLIADDCETCDTANHLVPALYQGLTFFNLADSCYNYGLNVMITSMDCDLITCFEEESCKLQFGVHPDYTNSVKKLAAAMYLGAYYMESLKESGTQSAIDAFYCYDTVKPYLEALGLNLTELKASFDTLTENCMCNNTFTNSNVGGLVYNPADGTGATGTGTNPSNPDANATDGLNSDGSTTIIYGDNIEVTEELIANILQQLLASTQGDTTESTYIYNALEAVLEEYFNSNNTNLLQTLFNSWNQLVTQELSDNDTTNNTFTDIFENILQQVINNNPSITTATTFGYIIQDAYKSVQDPCNTQGTFLIQGDANSTKDIVFKAVGTDSVNVTIAGTTYPISTTNTTVSIAIPTTGVVIGNYSFTGTAGSGVSSTSLVHVVSGSDVEITSSFCYDENSCNTPTVSINAPVANFTTNSPVLNSAVALTADASSSTLATSYSWDFGDGSMIVVSNSPTVSHIYATAGTYNVTLTITSADNIQDTETQLVRVNAAPQAIISGATSGTGPLTLNLSGLGSTDADGTITTYNWTIDGTTYTGATQNITFNTSGTKLIQLTVVDNDGATGSASTTVSVTTAANVAPTVDGITNNASATVADTVLFTAVNPADTDGTVVSYTWDFGDGSAPVTTATPSTSHSYGAVGSYTPSLFVTDDAGATSAAVTSAINITAVPAGAPTAVILSATPSGTTAPLTVSFVADSSDTDNVNYSWSFQDASGTSTATGITASYTWTTAGTYTVVLTVDNGAGTSATDSTFIVVNAAAPTLVLTNPVSPVAIVQNDGIIYNASGSTTPSGTTITGFTFDPGDGSTPVTQASGVYSHTYTTVGTYTATVTVTNDQGASDTENVAVTVAASAIVYSTLTGQITGPPGDQVILSVTTSGTGTPTGNAVLRDVNSNFLGSANVTVNSSTGGPGAGIGGGGGSATVETGTDSTTVSIPAGGIMYLTGTHIPGGVDANNDTTVITVFQQSNGDNLGSITLSNNGSTTSTPVVP